ncbi:MAG: metallophosphoesterase family protein [Oscillospiraceae bacterium]|jgi:hypothetical protein|nr:metallophosphoesterase family protein [Oscillospiraceae bacterium]
MKQVRKISTVLLSLLLILSLSVSSLAATPMPFDDWTANWDQHTSDYGKIALTPGKDATEMNFAWVTFLQDPDPAFKYGREADLSDAIDAEVSVVRTPLYFYSHKVSLTGLTPGTWYYSYRTNNAWQDPVAFTVNDPSNGFQVMYISDVQTGRSGDETSTSVLQHDSYGWYTTLNAAEEVAPGYSFILSGGDQVETATTKVQYNLLLASDYMKSTPIAATIGNHDMASSLYYHHFNNPNNYKDTVYSKGGYPYYFGYGEALFIVLDSNLSLKGDQDDILSAAVKAYPQAKWRVVMMHHSIYSTNGNDPDLRKDYAPLFDKYSIDIVLSGHEHIHGRTYPLKGGSVVENGGTVYLAAPSASGSNMNHTDERPDYIAAAYDFNVPGFNIISFADGALSVKTYRSDNQEIVDEFTIEKDTSTPASTPDSNSGFFHKVLKWFVNNLLSRILPYIPFFFNYEPII